MKRILITGGTVFVSRYIAEYYLKSGCEVYVLNRNTKKQSDGVILIESDRHCIGNKLKGIHFDTIIDVTAYDEGDIIDFINSLESFNEYIMISSSAVYPETEVQPFKETTNIGENKYWGKYGTNKINAEKALISLVPNAYILRPPYLYGPMNNLYRESFVFDCAIQDRIFYLPNDASMQLQFYYIEDLCRFIDKILETKPNERIFNVGNKETVSVQKWVELCYKVSGKTMNSKCINEVIEQRNFFCFYNYEYRLDTTLHDKLLFKTTPLEEGLKISFDWYINNRDAVNRKDYISYIDKLFWNKNKYVK